MNAPAELRAVFSVKEAAHYLNLGENEVTRMLRTGELEGFHTRGGGRWLVSRAACDRWVEGMEREARLLRQARAS